MALEKAKFLNNNDKTVIEVQFNPSSLLIETEAIVSEQKTQQLDSDSFIINMGGIRSRRLGVSLVLDSYHSTYSKVMSWLENKKKEDIKNIVDTFENFMNSSTDISFIWGKIIFNGIIRNLQTRYEVFDSDGSPIRASVDIFMEEKAYQGQDTGWSNELGIDQFDISDMSEEEALFGFMF
ncbi:MAG: hypothetical protein J6C55_01585 [Oscillospiraceae bacterium]|nr:hypothetical protein [Oscillospiraceae bacterium]